MGVHYQQLLNIEENRVFETHTFFSATRLAGGDSDLTILLSNYAEKVRLELTHH